MRKCEYRNCGKDITEMRKDAKYCDRNCKGCENKYRRRKKDLLDKYINNEKEKINNYKNLMEMIKGRTII
jgi:hypothetical protein